MRSYFSQLVDHMDEQHTAYLKNEVHWSAQVEELTRVLGEHCQIFASEQVRAIRRPRSSRSASGYGWKMICWICSWIWGISMQVN